MLREYKAPAVLTARFTLKSEKLPHQHGDSKKIVMTGGLKVAMLLVGITILVYLGLSECFPIYSTLHISLLYLLGDV
jgi:hypothetical protein